MGTRSLGVIYGFDYLRLISAGLVVVHHASVLAGRSVWTIGAGPDPGALGVGVFFVISGYLVMASQARTPRLSVFLLKRVLRIAPGLLMALILTALVLGPFVSALPASAYFSDARPYRYVLENLTLYAVRYDLPGVFAQVPYPGAVNGSLWSLRLEFTCYLALAALGLAGLSRAPVLIGCALAAALGFIGLGLTGWDASGAGRLAAIAALNGYLFLAGAALKRFDRRPPAWIALLGLILLPTPVWFLALPLAVVALGAASFWPRLPADLSYGIYIYSFPLQQMLAQYGRLSLLASLVLTLPFAAASWFLVEKPALRLKARLTGAVSPP